jgi:2-oxoacid:acceptor oxidoreductase gamma subunit (pyruvate/2-ketoisovalerate family)
MIEIRIHGRGGQGAVVASQILAKAAFLEGRYVQAFPQFGVERRGAPVLAFARVSDEPIRLRTHVYHPDHVIVLDPALMDYVDVTTGLDPKGWIVINSPLPPESFPLNESWNLATVAATAIAARHGIGTKTQPIVNTTMVGAFARVTGLVRLEHLERAIGESVPARAEANQEANREAYESVVIREASARHAEAVSL